MSDNSFSGRFRKLQNIMLRGGLSDGASAQDIAEMHGVDVNEIEKQLIMGERIEYTEHVKNNKDATKEEALAIGKKIAGDHLVEDPLYYTHLRKMERTVAKDAAQGTDSLKDENPLKDKMVKKPLPKEPVDKKPLPKLSSKTPTKPAEGGMRKDIKDKVMQKKDNILNRKQKVITNIEGKPKIGEAVEESIESENAKNNRSWSYKDKVFKDADEATNNLIYLLASKAFLDNEANFEKLYKQIIDKLDAMKSGEKVTLKNITVECKDSVSEEQVPSTESAKSWKIQYRAYNGKYVDADKAARHIIEIKYNIDDLSKVQSGRATFIEKYKLAKNQLESMKIGETKTIENNFNVECVDRKAIYEANDIKLTEAYLSPNAQSDINKELISAANAGDLPRVKRAIKNGADWHHGGGQVHAYAAQSYNLELVKFLDSLKYKKVGQVVIDDVDESEDEAFDDNNCQEDTQEPIIGDKSVCVWCKKEMPGKHAFCSDRCFEDWETDVVQKAETNESVDTNIITITGNTEKQIQADTPLYNTLKMLLNFSDRWALFGETENGKMEIELKRGDQKLEFYLECSDNKDVPSISLHRKITDQNDVCQEDVLEIPICDIFNLILSDDEIANYISESKPFISENSGTDTDTDTDEPIQINTGVAALASGEEPSDEEDFDNTPGGMSVSAI